MNSKTCILAAVAGVLSAGSVWAADTELQQQVNELKGQVAQLQQRQAASSKEVAATIESVLRDAEKRSQMLAAGDSGAGYDNGFFIRSGAFEMRPGVLFQFSNVTDYRSGITGNKTDQVENGFEVHRLELSLDGTAFTKDLTYRFMWNTMSEGGGLVLLDAYVNYMFCDAWGLTAGQQTAYFTYEDNLNDGQLLAAERSLLDAALGGYTNRVQGMGILYGNHNEKNPLNALVMLHDGSNSLNSNYLGHFPNDPGTVIGPNGPSNHAFDFGLLARAEYKLSGKWSDYGNMSAKDVKDNLFVIGGAVNWDQGGNGDLVGLTLDAMFKMNNGLALYGGVVYRYANAAISGDVQDQNDWGFMIQASYLLNPAWEIFGRYSLVQYDTAIVRGTDTEDIFHEITVGVNYYLGNNGSAGNRAKVTIDLNWLINGAPAPMTGLGYIGDSNFDTELVLRGQFQLAL
ncbi:MAG: porin [Tepidisphaerales bacterium]